MILVPLLNPKFANPLAARSCELRVRGTRTALERRGIGPVRDSGFGIDSQTGQLGPLLTRSVDTVHWGFSIQYSTYYLTNRFTPGKLPKDEPLYQFIPLVEFAFDTPRGEKTAATMNLGLAYVANTWQVAAEAVIPLNTEGARAVGARAHLFVFLDDLIPSIFGKPLLESMTNGRPEARGRR